jgi:hypothetical protein
MEGSSQPLYRLRYPGTSNDLMFGVLRALGTLMARSSSSINDLLMMGSRLVSTRGYAETRCILARGDRECDGSIPRSLLALSRRNASPASEALEGAPRADGGSIVRSPRLNRRASCHRAKKRTFSVRHGGWDAKPRA